MTPVGRAQERMRMPLLFSGDVGHGREVTVPVTQFKGRDAACADQYRRIDRVRFGVREHPVAVQLPHTAQRLEARCWKASRAW